MLPADWRGLYRGPEGGSAASGGFPLSCLAASAGGPGVGELPRPPQTLRCATSSAPAFPRGHAHKVSFLLSGLLSSVRLIRPPLSALEALGLTGTLGRLGREKMNKWQ